MMKVGDFSRLSRISIRMLRYYDEYDILKPVVKEENGYRYYGKEQLEVAFRIVSLRNMGFSISEVQELLKKGQDKTFVKELLLKKQQAVHEDIKTMQETLNRLEKAAIMLDKENWIMNAYKVEVKEMPEVYIMGRRGIIPTYDKEGILWDELCSAFSDTYSHVKLKGKNAGRVYYYEEGYTPKDVDVEVAFEVDGVYEDSEKIKFHTMSAKTCACVTYQGSYDKMIDVHYAISDWITQNDKELDGYDFCIYHVGYGNSNNPDEFITEVCFPIK